MNIDRRTVVLSFPAAALLAPGSSNLPSSSETPGLAAKMLLLLLLLCGSGSGRGRGEINQQILDQWPWGFRGERYVV